MREVVVSERDAGQRLDKKNITLNGKKAAGGEKLQPGDAIRLFLSEETLEKFSPDAQAAQKRQKGLRPEVIYEDDQALLLNKPAGMLSQKSAARDYSLTEWLRDYLDGEGFGQNSPGF